MYGKDTVYVVGNSKTNNDNAITQKFNSFFIGLVVDITDGTIVDVGCSAMLNTTQDFIKSMFINRNINEDIACIEEEVERRYHGSSHRAIIVAYKDAVKKYFEAKDKY